MGKVNIYGQATLSTPCVFL